MNELLQSNIDKNAKNKREMSPKAFQTVNKLKKSQEILKNNIYKLKRNQKLLENESFLNVSGSIIEDTIRQSHIKTINEKKQILLEQLEGIQSQVEHIISNEKKIDRNTLIKCFLENFESDDNYEQKAIQYERQHLLRKEKMLNEINLTQEKRQREYEEKEKKTIETKERYLLELKLREKEAISQRRKEIELKMKKMRDYININSNKKENDYLFYKMSNKYEKHEKKLIDRIKLTKRNKIVSKEEIMDLNKRLEYQKIRLNQDFKERAMLMKEMWKNRSQIIPQYKNPIEKIIIEERKIKKEDEELNQMKAMLIAKERKLFGEKKVPAPSINEKLKNEREKRIIRIEHKEQRKKRRIKEPLVKVPIPIPMPQAKLKARAAKEKLNKANSVTSFIRKSSRYIKSPKVIAIRPEKPPNYLIEFKKKRQSKSMNKTDWTKVIDNPKGNKLQNIQLIKAHSEVLEEKVKNKKAFLRINGGYEKNPQLGNSLGDLLIESIKAKMAIITNLKLKA